MNSKNLSDEQLIARINQGERKMLNTLFDRYIDRLLRYVELFINSAEEAQDLTQDILSKVFLSLHSFKGTGRFEAWFFILARRSIIDSYRKKKLKTYCYEEDKIHQLSQKNNFSEEESPINDLLTCLPAKEKEILQLRFMEGLSYAEISQVTNMKEGSIRNAVSRAINRIKENKANEL